eukprot:284815910_3
MPIRSSTRWRLTAETLLVQSRRSPPGTASGSCTKHGKLWLSSLESWMLKSVARSNSASCLRNFERYSEALRFQDNISTFQVCRCDLQREGKCLLPFHLSPSNMFSPCSPKGQYPTVVSFNATLTIFTSKQRPRKISILGSDGRDYFFLLKGHEDLKQDERVMQVFWARVVLALLLCRITRRSRLTGPTVLLVYPALQIPSRALVCTCFVLVTKANYLSEQGPSNVLFRHQVLSLINRLLITESLRVTLSRRRLLRLGDG